MAHNDHVPTTDVLARYPRFVHPHRHPQTHAGALARKTMIDRRLVGIVDQLVGPPYAAQSMFYFKPPGARGQAFHQDNASLRAYPDVCVAAWIAVDDANAENGGLMVVPGSHKANADLICPEDADPELSFSTREIKMGQISKTAEPVQTELKAGDVLLFHGALVHGSKPNSSASTFRRALIYHYIPQTAKEIDKFYLPLLDLEGKELNIDNTHLGGPCGDGWQLKEA